jgi:predicted Zn-dependent protease
MTALPKPFLPRLPMTVMVSRRALVSAASLGLGLGATVALSGCIAPAGLGPGLSPLDRRTMPTVMIDSITPLQLTRASDLAWQTLLARGPIADAGLLERLARVASRLRAGAVAVDPSVAGWRDEVLVVPGSGPDAWCLPGGRCAITPAMAALGTRPGEANPDAVLAVALAHEMAHLIRDHPRERIARARAGGLADEAAVLLSHPHDRVHEDEADRLAMELLARAGFDPGLALGFWSRALTGALAVPAPAVPRWQAWLPAATPAAVRADPFAARHPSHPGRLADLDRYAVRLQPLVVPETVRR